MGLNHAICMVLLSLVAVVTVASAVAPSCPKGCHCATTPTKQFYNAKCSSLDAIVRIRDTQRKQTHLMQYLDLSHANITKFNPDVLKTLVNLHKLELSHNHIVDIPLKLPLPRLTYLGLSANQLTQIPTDALPPHITHLDVSQNTIQYLPEDLLTLTYLRSLQLLNNPIQCSCNNWEVYNILRQRNVSIDTEKCLNVIDQKVQYWEFISYSTVCNPSLDDVMLGDAAGSGGGQILDFDQDTEKPDDDLHEFMPVNNDMKIITPTTQEPSTTVKIENKDSDFEFDEERESSTLRSTSSVLTTTERQHEIFESSDEGSGLGPIILPEESNEGSGQENETMRTPTVRLGAADILDYEGSTWDSDDYNEDNATDENELFKMETTTAEWMVVSEGTQQSLPGPETETVSEEPVEVTEAPFQQQKVNVVDAVRVENEGVTTEEDSNINEELGQANTEAGQGKRPFGTIVFLCVLAAIVICMVGYVVYRKTMARRNRRNRRNPTDDDELTAGTELRDIDKTVALLNQENEKRSNGVATETTPIVATTEVPPIADSPVGNGINGNAPEDSEDPPQLSNGQISPPRSPFEAERVRITVAELTDSVPKTPVLVTRTRSSAGDKIIVTPNLN